MINRSRSLKRIFPAFGAALVASFALVALTAASAPALSYVPAGGTFPKTYSAANGVAAEFLVAGQPSQRVRCESSPWTTQATGQFTGATSGLFQLSFKGCKLPTYNIDCTTAGQPTGTIVTKLLGVTPVYLNAEQTKYGLRLAGEGAGPNWWEPGTVATFACGGAGSFTWSGWMTVEITNPLNVNTKSFSIVDNEGTQKAGSPYGLTNGKGTVTPLISYTMVATGEDLAKFAP